MSGRGSLSPCFLHTTPSKGWGPHVHWGPESETPLRADSKLESLRWRPLAELRGYLGRCHQSPVPLSFSGGRTCSADSPRLLLLILQSISPHEVLACLILSWDLLSVASFSSNDCLSKRSDAVASQPISMLSSSPKTCSLICSCFYSQGFRTKRSCIVTKCMPFFQTYKWMCN